MLLLLLWRRQRGQRAQRSSLEEAITGWLSFTSNINNSHVCPNQEMALSFLQDFCWGTLEGPPPPLPPPLLPPLVILVPVLSFP